MHSQLRHANSHARTYSLVVAATAMLIGLMAASSAWASTTTRVSIHSGGAQGNAASGVPAISRNGQWVTFESDASTLVTGDTNLKRDVFRHDRSTNTTILVSRANGATGTLGNNHSYAGNVSNDGRYVAFWSTASNLVSGDTNLRSDVFVRDCTTNTTILASSTSAGQANGNSSAPVISGDGKWLAFQSDATNLVPGDTNGRRDIFLRNMTTGAITRVSVSTGGVQGNNNSYTPSISSDGRYVAFWSYASNLVPNDTNGVADVFVYDRIAGTTTRANVLVDGTQGNADSYTTAFAISDNGQYVAFESYASNFVGGDTNGSRDVFVVNRITGALTRCSVSNAGVQGNSHSYSPAISGDGLLVGFASNATNLVSSDTNAVSDIFLRDVVNGLTTRQSLSSADVQANGASLSPSLNANGRTLAFTSKANNLVAGDTNGTDDVFVREYTTSTMQADGWIKNSTEGAGGWIGDDIYNTTGLNQTKSQTVPSGTAATYNLRVQNDGAAAERFVLTGTGSSTGWTVQYIDDASAADITAAVTGAGYTTPPINTAASMTFTLVVTPNASLWGNQTKEVLFTATPQTDATKPDTVKAVTTTTVVYAADIMIRNGAEPDAAYLTNDLYETTPAAQIKTQTLKTGQTAVYVIRVQNDGNVPDLFRVRCTSAVPADWAHTFWSAKVGGSNITADVTGPGWQIPLSLLPGEWYELRVEVTAVLPTSVGSPLVLDIRANSQTDVSKLDTCRATTTNDTVYQADLMIRNLGEGAADWLTDNLYEPTPALQIKAQSVVDTSVNPLAQAVYEILIQNDGDLTDTIRVTGTALGGGWTSRYEDSSATDITADVTGAGWLTPPLAPGAAVMIKLFVTADGTVPGGPPPTPCTVAGRSDSLATSPIDAVRADTTCALRYQPDMEITDPSNGGIWVGDGIYNDDGTNQTGSDKVPGGTLAVYFFSVTNDGNVADAFTLTGTPGTADWTVQYYTLFPLVDVTAAVVGGTQSTASLSPGQSEWYLLLVTPNAGPTPPDGEVFDVLIQADSQNDPAAPPALDVVKASTEKTKVGKPDLHIRNAGEASYIGNDIYNNDGTNQTKEQDVDFDQTAVYEIKLENDGNLDDTFHVYCDTSALDPGWSVQFFDALSGGNDITTQVTTAPGWQSPLLLAPGGSTEIRMEITGSWALTPDPAINPPNPPVRQTLLITATADTWTANADTVRTDTDCNPFPRPDLWIRNAAEPNFAGDDIYSSIPLPEQTKTRNVAAGGTAVFFMAVQNDGNTENEPYTLTIQNVTQTGGGSWTIAAFDAVVGGNPILTPPPTPWNIQLDRKELGTPVYDDFRLELTPDGAVPVGGQIEMDVQVVSGVDPTRVDVVHAIAVRAAGFQPDMWIWDTAGGDWDEDNYYTYSGDQQSDSQVVNNGATAHYQVQLQNDGDTDTFDFDAFTSSDANWTITYYSDWTHTNTFNPATTTFTLPPGGVQLIEIDVTPTASAPGLSTKEVLLRARSTSDLLKKDAVKCYTTVNPVRQPDAQIKNSGEPAANYVRIGPVFGAWNSGVPPFQQKTQGVAVNTTAKYFIRVQNISQVGATTDRFRIQDPVTAVPAGWTLKYYSVPNDTTLFGGTDITYAVTHGGWVSGYVAVGGYIYIRVDMIPSIVVGVGGSLTRDIRAISVNDPTKWDEVEAVTTRTS